MSTVNQSEMAPMTVRDMDTILMPKKRIVCFYCAKDLRGSGELTICTSQGVAILCCKEHAAQGDWLVFALNGERNAR